MTKQFENAIKAVHPEGIFSSSVIPSYYDIGLEDMIELMEMARSGDGDIVFRSLAMAFAFGFAMGNRATINRNMKKL